MGTTLDEVDRGIELSVLGEVETEFIPFGD